MSAPNVQALIGFIGVAAQLAGSLLLVALFLLLRRYTKGRPYFLAWGRAWMAVAIAILALVVRFFSFDTLPDGSAAVRLLYGLYQLGKLAYVGLMVAGTIMYARGMLEIPRMRLFAGGALLFAAASAASARSLDTLVVVQAPVTILGLTYCGYLLLTLPAERGSLGSRITGSCFAAIASLWTVYLAAFGLGRLARMPQGNGLEVIVQYNGYLDLVLQVLLGFAMIVLLMEDAKREADTAHAELARAHEQLRSASYHDALTGAMNRRAFAEGIGLEPAHAQGGAVVALDLDNLKLVNDSFGHAAGDRLLRRLAEVVRSTVRPTDQLYRWGGDEFLLVLTGARAADVLGRVEEVIEKSNLLRVRESGADMLRLLVSVGAADFAGASDLEQAVERADNAMLARKAERKKLGADAAGPPVIRLA